MCGSFQALTQEGFNPVSFAYPYGAWHANAEQMVQSCDFSNARTDRGGSTTAARRWAGVRRDDPATKPLRCSGRPTTAPPGRLTLSYLENSVTTAAQNGGGWVPLTFHKICSQTYDPADYSSCTSDTASPTELDTFTAFLTWLQIRRPARRAPAGTVVKIVRQALGS